MTLIQQKIIINNDNFLETLEKYFGEEYSLGIHGIENGECWIKIDGEWKLNIKRIDEIKNTILNEGIQIQTGRTLLSTARFDEIESYLGKGYYDAGGVIIALPKILKNHKGEEIFIGSPNEELVVDRNYELTSLSEIILPEYTEKGGFLSSMFVLAKYEKVGDDYIKLIMNQNHIYFNGGLVNDEIFNDIKTKIKKIFKSYEVTGLDELSDKGFCIGVHSGCLNQEQQAILETLNQYNNKNKKTR